MSGDGFTVVSCRNKKRKNIVSSDNDVSHEKKNISKISSNIPIKNVIPHNCSTIQTQYHTSRKRILCNNMFRYGKCPYGSDCVYAHSLKEQKVDSIRKHAYDILGSTYSLKDIDLVRNGELYDAFLQLTHVCNGCVGKTCLGGYNCKNGAIGHEYVICYNDLVFGKCSSEICDKIHLTRRGLVSYKLQDMMYNGYKKSETSEYINTLLKNIPAPDEIIDCHREIAFCKQDNMIDDDAISLSDEDVPDNSIENKYVLTIIP